jgi:hypothetical protein
MLESEVREYGWGLSLVGPQKVIISWPFHSCSFTAQEFQDTRIDDIRPIHY